MKPGEVVDNIKCSIEERMEKPYAPIALVGVGIAIYGAMVTVAASKNETEKAVKQELKEKDAERYSSLKSMEIDVKTIEACERLAISEVSGEKQNIKNRCSSMRTNLENYKKLSKKIAEDIKRADAKKAVKGTAKGIQMRKK